MAPLASSHVRLPHVLMKAQRTHVAFLHTGQDLPPLVRDKGEGEWPSLIPYTPIPYTPDKEDVQCRCIQVL